MSAVAAPVAVKPITLAEIRLAGVKISAEGEKLQLKGSYDSLVGRIKASKLDLLAALSAERERMSMVITGLVETREEVERLVLVKVATPNFKALIDLVDELLKRQDQPAEFFYALSRNEQEFKRLLKAVRMTPDQPVLGAHGLEEMARDVFGTGVSVTPSQPKETKSVGKAGSSLFDIDDRKGATFDFAAGDL